MELLFWPMIIASVVLAYMGLKLKKPSLLVVACLLIFPLSLYLAATPLFRWWGLIFPFFYLGAALSLKKDFRRLTVLLISPNIILIGWIGYTVLFQ